MEEGNYRTLTLVLIGLGALFSGGVFALSLLSYTHGVPSTTTIAAGAVLVFLVVLAAVTVPRRVASYVTQRRAERTMRPAPYDMSRDLLAYLDQAKRIWGPDGSYLTSFPVPSQNILNLIQPAAGKMRPDLRVFVDQAVGLVNGWRCQRQVLRTLLAETEGMNADQLTQGVFLFLLKTLSTVATAGGDTANQFVANLNGSQVVFPKSVTTEWNNFAGKANALVDSIETMVARATREFGEDPKLFPTRVETL
jgi:hypothetical protein